MRKSLNFSSFHRFDHSRPDITVPVILGCGGRSVPLLAKVDTGATFCVFERHFGDALDLEIEHGHRESISSIHGPFDAYGHEVSLSVLGIEHDSMIYFYADYHFGRNVLGRHGWLDRVRLGIVDHDCEIYLAPYNG